MDPQAQTSESEDLTANREKNEPQKQRLPIPLGRPPSNPLFSCSDDLAELYGALAAAQGEMEPASMNRVNFYGRAYATLADIRAAIRQPLSENGLCLMQWPQEIRGDGELIQEIRMVTRLAHKSGQWIQTSFTWPATRAGKKLADGTNEVEFNAQSIASAITYGSRYGMCAMLGVVADEDDDGETASGVPAGQNRARTQGQRNAPPPRQTAPPRQAPPPQTPPQQPAPPPAATKPVAPPATPPPPKQEPSKPESTPEPQQEDPREEQQPEPQQEESPAETGALQLVDQNTMNEITNIIGQLWSNPPNFAVSYMKVSQNRTDRLDQLAQGEGETILRSLQAKLAEAGAAQKK